MIVGRVFPSARTTASAIESTAKGATGPEEAVETTNGAVDDTGNSSERSPADKLLLVERGGLGIVYNQNKKKTSEERGNEEPTQHDSWRGNHGRRLAKFCLAVVVVGCFNTPTGNRCTGPAKKPRYRKSDHRSVQLRVSDKRVETNHNPAVETGRNDKNCHGRRTKNF